MVKKYVKILAVVGFAYCMQSCKERRKSYYIPVEEAVDTTNIVREETQETETVNNSFSVAYKPVDGVKVVHVKLNDAASFDAIFDTGCSGMLISLQEALSLIKAGTLTQADQLESQKSSIANGEIIENQVFKMHEVTLMDTNGKPHTVYDIPVTVMENPGAAVLIGNMVIDQLAEYSYTIDLKKHTIVFQ